MREYGEDTMAKTMKRVTVITLLLTVCCFVGYRLTHSDLLFSLLITFGTTAYHFAIRLLVGFAVNSVMHNRADHHKRWFRVDKWEMKLYQRLKVKQWKNKMPTYSADTFDISKHSWEEILQATCQSELVHEINAFFSFLPILASLWVGAFWVFFLTSVLGAAFDWMFVMMQRFNRARIVKLNRKRDLSKG